jgi:hypothetical protein
MLRGVMKILAAGAAVAIGAAAPVRAGDCVKADFETVVDEAAGALRDLTAANKPKFQDKLRQLKDKRGWAHEQFMREAAPFVQDDKITAFDQQSNDLLAKIASGGEAGAAATKPDCTNLESLRASMRTLVETQTAKWAYMAAKIDAELGK